MNIYSVDIKKIDWLDKENPEASVFFELEGNRFWAFSHPADFFEGETVDVYLTLIPGDMEEASFWEENKEQKREIVSSESETWRYYCYGKIVGIHPVAVDCGVISFSLGDWTNDETVIGSYVYFVIARLDISRAIAK